MFICGSGSFAREEEDDRYTSPCSTPKRSKKNTGFCRTGKDHSSNKNPYAGRGLDKFNALLAELDDRKQKIYTQVGSDEISLVRFVYPNDSDKVKPIVVKAKERSQEKYQRGNDPVTNPAVPAVVQVRGKIESAAAIPDDKEAKRSCTAGFRLENLRRPYYYLPLIVVLILLFLVVYGRSFAILCTSIGWYLIPTVNSWNSSAASSSTRTLKRKKEFTRRFSEKNMVNKEGSSSPTSVLNGLSADKSPQEQEVGRRRSF
ncbi:hypothetical protein F511_24169 [Dorcoceras hygrometricum]|uniref:ZCF37 n=1 Tax=Dorcoceras hygrometricum TaxID=472368 RepID=A0A2Z7CGX2_9LAMI|nr:hypothetical protein F511_24169 [Dorcoceras hygrometricum]